MNMFPPFFFCLGAPVRQEDPVVCSLATKLQNMFDNSLSYDLLLEIVAVAPQFKSSSGDPSLQEMSDKGDYSWLSDRASILVSMNDLEAYQAISIS
jgi:hypothetical protein